MRDYAWTLLGAGLACSLLPTSFSDELEKGRFLCFYLFIFLFSRQDCPIRVVARCEERGLQNNSSRFCLFSFSEMAPRRCVGDGDGASQIRDCCTACSVCFATIVRGR